MCAHLCYDIDIITYKSLDGVIRRKTISTHLWNLKALKSVDQEMMEEAMSDAQRGLQQTRSQST